MLAKINKSTLIYKLQNKDDKIKEEHYGSIHVIALKALVNIVFS